MHRLQGCLMDRSYAGRLDYRLDVSVVCNCVILEFFSFHFLRCTSLAISVKIGLDWIATSVTACAFSRLLA